MKIILVNFVNTVDKTASQKNDSDVISRGCFCGCDWHGCDCEYNCATDDDCTQDTY